MDSNTPSASPPHERPPLDMDLNPKPPATHTPSLPYPAHMAESYNSRRQFGQQYQMPPMETGSETLRPLLLTHDDEPSKSDDDYVPAPENDDGRFDRESSSESLFVRDYRTRNGDTRTKAQATPPAQHHQLELMQSNPPHDATPEHPVSQLDAFQSLSTSASVPATTPMASAVRPRKKPGPRPWVPKPLKKNDMGAKIKVIEDIEALWGKNFITAYIPKCHRPLTKSSKGKKTRNHERNPKNWLPSTLKSILTIAKLTQNKNWLKQAMHDVVRYRIKHTGNRKPQLTTTDFDVLEDMLIKGWDVEYSFPIRYKHLYVKGMGDEVSDQDIDNILGIRIDNQLAPGNHAEEDGSTSGSEDGVTDEDNEDGTPQPQPPTQQQHPRYPQHHHFLIQPVHKRSPSPTKTYFHATNAQNPQPSQWSASNPPSAYATTPPAYQSYAYGSGGSGGLQYSHFANNTKSPRIPQTETHASLRPGSASAYGDFGCEASVASIGGGGLGMAVSGTAFDDENAAIEAELQATELELKIARLRARQANMRLLARSRG